jgi:mannobiose 2-epimerase
MKNIFALLLTIIFVWNNGYCIVKQKITREQKAKLEQLKKEVSDNLNGNILSFWTSKMVDEVNGGFYGRADFTGKVYPDAEKGGILNARILWTYSSAYRVTHNPEYLQIAKRAKEYILTHFIDSQYGGAYRSLNADGEPSDTRKQTYTQSFFIYGLAEYSRATGDKEALNKAMEIFKLFEKYAFDKESNGYFEVFSRDWQRVRDRLIGEKDDVDEKTMNTHLHVLEAYANLYRVSGDKVVGDRLRNLVEIFLDKIIDKKSSHLICFMDRNWNSTSTVDSYGHDIESSWLIYEATDLLKDPKLLARVKEKSISIANAAAEGLLKNGSMLSDKDNSTGHVRTQLSWWEQAETIVGYLNAFELTGNEKYLDNSINCWNYTKQHFVDLKNGGWFSSVTESGEPGRGDKAGFWVCPYHNGRMCMEVMERVRE